MANQYDINRSLSQYQGDFREDQEDTADESSVTSRYVDFLRQFRESQSQGNNQYNPSTASNRSGRGRFYGGDEEEEEENQSEEYYIDQARRFTEGRNRTVPRGDTLNPIDYLDGGSSSRLLPGRGGGGGHEEGSRNPNAGINEGQSAAGQAILDLIEKEKEKAKKEPDASITAEEKAKLDYENGRTITDKEKEKLAYENEKNKNKKEEIKKVPNSTLIDKVIPSKDQSGLVKFSSSDDDGRIPISSDEDAMASWGSDTVLGQDGVIMGAINTEESGAWSLTSLTPISGQGQGEIERSGISEVISCDDPNVTTNIGTFIGEGAPPSLFEELTVLPEEFIFEQRGALEAIEEDQAQRTIFDFLSNRVPWWSGEIYNKNLIIPQQFYYNDYLMDSLFFRNPSEQTDPRYNFGSDVEELKDDFRYSCGGTWDHTSVVFGMPTTVYDSAEKIDYEKGRVPNLENTAVARQNRGMLFYHIDPGRAEIEGVQDSDDPTFYKSYLQLYAWQPYLYRVFSNIQNRNLFPGELPRLFYDFIFNTTSQSLTNPNPNRILDDNVLDRFSDPILRNFDTTNERVTTTSFYSKNFFDHTFQAPVGYSRDYLDFYPATVASDDLVEIKSFYPPADLSIDDPSYQNPLGERSKKSFYRTLYDEFEFPNIEGGVEWDEPCSPDKVQKFPPEEVRTAKAMTDYLYENQYALTSDMEDQQVTRFVNAFYDKFDVYNTVTFRMSKRKEISSMMELCGLTPMFFEMLDQCYPVNSTYYSQVLDGWLNTNPNYTDRRQQNENFTIDSDLAAVNLRPNEIANPFLILRRMLEQKTFLNRPEYTGNVDLFSYPLGFRGNGFFALGPEQKEQYLSERLSNMVERRLIEVPGLEDGETFEEHMNKFVNFYNPSYHRTAFEMFNGQTCFSEVLAYRVEKLEAETGELVQNFFFANTQNINEFTFLDTQVLPGKRYIYRIYTINFVVGSKYNYEAAQMMYEKVNPTDIYDTSLELFTTETTSEQLFANRKFTKLQMPLSIEPNIRLIEAPYYEKEITTVSSDLAPLFPDVSVAESYRTDKDNLQPTMFLLTPRFGFATEVPVAMRPEDEQMIQIMKERQQATQPLLPSNLPNILPEQVVYRSDSTPTHYEAFYSFIRPNNYSDLYNKNYTVTNSDMPYFDLDVPLNKEMFITFRSKDAGGVSNPSPIYQFIKHNYGDGTYFSFEILEIDPPEATITFENLLSIEPSIFQSSINIDPDETTTFFTYNYWRRLGSPQNQNPIELAAMRSDQNNFIPFTTVPPSIEMITLGSPDLFESDLIWDRKFKFRITSNSSENSFDINTEFKYSRIILEQEMNDSEVNRLCYRTEDGDLDNRRRQNAANSNANLNKVGGTSYNETIRVERESLVTTDDLFLPGTTDAEEVFQRAQEGYDSAGRSGRGRSWDNNMDRAAEGTGEFNTNQDRYRGFQDRAAAATVLETGEITTNLRDLNIFMRVVNRNYG